MAHDYDTAEIKLTASRIRTAAGEIRVLSSANIARMSSELHSGFKGMAADALNQQLEILRSDILGISKGLDSIQQELMAFAKRLEEADKKLAREISRK